MAFCGVLKVEIKTVKFRFFADLTRQPTVVTPFRYNDNRGVLVLIALSASSDYDRAIANKRCVGLHKK